MDNVLDCVCVCHYVSLSERDRERERKKRLQQLLASTCGLMRLLDWKTIHSSRMVKNKIKTHSSWIEKTSNLSIKCLEFYFVFLFFLVFHLRSEWAEAAEHTLIARHIAFIAIEDKIKKKKKRQLNEGKKCTHTHNTRNINIKMINGR